jgi:hypothetical protein
MGKLLLETSSLWRRFSVSRDVLSNSLPRGDRGSLAYLDLRFVCGPIYLSRAVAELRAQGEFMPDTLLSHIGPLGWEHISFNGDYFWPSEPFKDGSVRCEIPAPRSSMLLSVLKQILAMTPTESRAPQATPHAKFSGPMIFRRLDHEQAGGSAPGARRLLFPLGSPLSFFSAVPRLLLTAARRFSPKSHFRESMSSRHNRYYVECF